jgi:glycosyltransferase involved in cell wall biosynthesis
MKVKDKNEQTVAPTITIGLPVYNGEEYLEASLEGLLAQTYRDFELIISDNASTDRTPDICRAYASRDSRIRLVRQPHNLGAGPNHNLLVPMARGRYFKWAAHDDMYAPELLERCIAAFEDHPDAVLVNVGDVVVDPHGEVVERPDYRLDSSNPRPHLRLRSLLNTDGGNDIYGLIRTDVMSAVRPHNSYLHADRTFMAELALAGPWYQVPEILYFRRDHPNRTSRTSSSRGFATRLDPRRQNRWRHPLLRLYVEYVWGWAQAVWSAPIPVGEKSRCMIEVATWFTGRLRPKSMRELLSRDGVLPAGRKSP